MIPADAIEEVPLEDWCFAWRIEQSLPILDRERIRPLSPASSKQISDSLDAINLHYDFPFRVGLFRRTESLIFRSDEQDALEKEDHLVKKWLYHRGIPFTAPVFLIYDSSNVVRTTWKMLIRHWRLFYYPASDDITICDPSLNWCLLFFHEDELHFGSNLESPTR